MKVKISTIIEIKDEFLLKDEFRFPSATQLIFDTITSVPFTFHAGETFKWCAKAQVGTDKEDKSSPEYKIFSSHDYWADKCNSLKWDYEEIKDEN